MARNTATAKNKLPVFGDNAEIDNSIVADTSGLRNTGFQYNTTIKSAEVNTYLKMLINGMSGLIDSVYDSGVNQGEIKATSTANEIKNYIKLGLNNIIKSTTVDTAVHADEATNVDAITNNDDGDNANVNFAIGDQSFSKTVNNVANATKATALDSIDVGDSSHAVYFDSNGKPVKIDTVANASNADNATKLTTARTITLGDQLAGSATFDGTGDITIDATLTKKGQDGKPIYIDSAGKAIEVSYIDQNILIAPDDSQHTKLSAGSLSNRWQNDPTTSNSNIFIADGAKEMMDSSGNRTNVGDSNKPVYFASGKPVVTTALSLDDGVKLGSSTYSVEKVYFWSMWYKYNPDFISIEGASSTIITKDKWVNGLFKTSTVLKNKGYKVNDFILLVGESSNSWSTFGFLKISSLNDSDTYFVGMIYSTLSANSGSGSIYRISSFNDANNSFGIPILLNN